MLKKNILKKLHNLLKYHQSLTKFLIKKEEEEEKE